MFKLYHKFCANSYLSIALLTMFVNFLSNIVQSQMGFHAYSPLMLWYIRTHLQIIFPAKLGLKFHSFLNTCISSSEQCQELAHWNFKMWYNDVNLKILFSVSTTDHYFWAKNTLPESKRLKRQVNGLSHVLHKP